MELQLNSLNLTNMPFIPFIGFGACFAILIYLVIRRIKIKNEEEFEQRDH